MIRASVIALSLALAFGAGLGWLSAQESAWRAERNGRDVARCTLDGGAWSWSRSEDGTVTGTCVPRTLLPGRFGR